jgi:hypothetical protein
VKIELPATALLDLEEFIPEDIKIKLAEKSLDLKNIKFTYLKNGLIPGELFSLETLENTVGSETRTKFHVYLV